jgi:hypothetical protein
MHHIVNEIDRRMISPTGGWAADKRGDWRPGRRNRGTIRNRIDRLLREGIIRMHATIKPE